MKNRNEKRISKMKFDRATEVRERERERESKLNRDFRRKVEQQLNKSEVSNEGGVRVQKAKQR
jgi:hypothetical protein